MVDPKKDRIEELIKVHLLLVEASDRLKATSCALELVEKIDGVGKSVVHWIISYGPPCTP